MLACPALMKQIQERVLHIYVAGRTSLEWNKEQKRLLPMWLVYDWDETKKRYNRSLDRRRGKGGRSRGDLPFASHDR